MTAEASLVELDDTETVVGFVTVEEFPVKLVDWETVVRFVTVEASLVELDDWETITGFVAVVISVSFEEDSVTGDSEEETTLVTGDVITVKELK